MSGGISAGLTSGIQSVAEGGNFWKGSYPGIPHGPAEPDILFASSGNQNNYSGYYGYNTDTWQVKYVGITGRDPEIRFAEHASSGTSRASLHFEVKDGNIPNLLHARIWEQMQINKYGLVKNGGQLYNLRNEISRKYWLKYGIY